MHNSMQREMTFVYQPCNIVRLLLLLSVSLPAPWRSALPDGSCKYVWSSEVPVLLSNAGEIIWGLDDLLDSLTDVYFDDSLLASDFESYFLSVKARMLSNKVKLNDGEKKNKNKKTKPCWSVHARAQT